MKGLNITESNCEIFINIEYHYDDDEDDDEDDDDNNRHV